MDDKELHDYLHSMSKKERRELAARLRLVKPKRRKDYKQRITDHQRQQLVYELKSRGFDGSEKEVDLLLRGGSIPSEQACVSSIGTSVCRKMISGETCINYAVNNSCS